MRLKNPYNSKGCYPAVLFISVLNGLVLIYAAWVKYNTGTCPSCNQPIPFPFSGVAVALAGFLACIILAFFVYLQERSKLYRYGALFTAGCSSAVASYLQIIQLLWAKKLCYPCFTAASLFYLSFGLLLYKFIKWRYFNSSIPLKYRES